MRRGRSQVAVGLQCGADDDHVADHVVADAFDD